MRKRFENRRKLKIAILGTTFSFLGNAMFFEKLKNDEEEGKR